MICQRSKGFVYYVAVTGITGTRAALPPDLIAQVQALRALTPTPVCAGFGISKPEQAAAVAALADGVIVGSALVKKIEEGIQQGLERNALAQYVSILTRQLAHATHQTVR